MGMRFCESMTSYTFTPALECLLIYLLTVYFTYYTHLQSFEVQKVDLNPVNLDRKKNALLNSHCVPQRLQLSAKLHGCVILRNNVGSERMAKSIIHSQFTHSKLL